MKNITFIFFISLFISFKALSQEEKQKATFFRIGIDPVRLYTPLSYAISGGSDSANISHTIRYELYSAITYKKFLSFALDGGYSQVDQNLHIHTYNYQAHGLYFKPGFDFNINYNDKIQNFVGLRYGLSPFKETGHIKVSGTYWNNDYNYTWNRNIFAQWIEVVTGIRFQVKRIGFAVSGRLKFLTFFPRPPVELEERHIPGYGKNDSMSGGVNFEISYRLSKK
jgi:hypothetical protein